MSDTETLTARDVLADSMPFEADIKAALKFVDRGEYTTKALLAICEVHLELGDEEGAALLREFARQFAAYEAAVL